MLRTRGEGRSEILVVEDDPGIGKAVQKGLSEAGHECTWVKDGKEGLQQAMSQKYDVVVLDLLLPGESGMTILESMRGAGIGTPVLVLTALGGVEDRVTGLTRGADDYLVKPFAFPELLARIKAVCRRSMTRPSPTLEVGDICLNLASRRVTRGGVEINISPTEFSLLEFLMRHAGQVVTRKMLCEHIWYADWEGMTNVVEVHINRLRSKLDGGFPTSAIETIRGRGYAIRAN